ncbi:hypothetical protein C5B96_11695 [Subtercola sp. Z020]|uniref:hypothetical protein n=1 Tax=Subtercola sp. Z020 TaxID=2080582 RepID=UPI000CE756DB|nr:hypothetical protein [Subtercola sp. Z020]PPF79691.1 hypothetical protein C5B96_11695 [Subtercola sp. Z020]
MSLTRKRQKALKNLRSTADKLWSDQQEILDRANHVAREAKLQLGELTKEEVVPRVRTATKTASDSIAQSTAHSLASVKVASDQAKSKFNSDILPAIGGGLASAAGALGVSDNKTVKSAISKVSPQAAKKNSHVGTYVALVTGAVALVGIGYAVWQTFRADDELWISEDEIDAGTTAS